MTHMTTDAAEERAREVLKETALRVSDDIFTNNYGEPQVIAAMLAFATAEAASGAGEREDALEAAARAMCDRVNGIGDYDENIGQRRTGWLAQAKAGIAAYLASLPPATDPAMALDDETIERVAKAIYEEDDPWHKAWPWPDLNPDAQGGAATANRYRDIARKAIAATKEPVK